MAKLSKEQYSRRNENAAIRMSENKEVSTLTEKQHEVLAELCSFRHELHCNQEDLFASNGANFAIFWNFLREEIYNKLSDANLPKISFPNSDEISTDYDYSDFGLSYEEAMEDVINYASEVNNRIEKYLKEIDNNFATNYCPTGALRL